jgi:hypothetical protein
MIAASTQHPALKAPPVVREIVRAVVSDQPSTVESQVAESARRFWDLPDVRQATGLARQLVNLAIREIVYDVRTERNRERLDDPENGGPATMGTDTELL